VYGIKNIPKPSEDIGYVELRDERKGGEFNAMFTFNIKENEIQSNWNKPDFIEYTKYGVIRFGYNLMTGQGNDLGV